MEMKRFFLFSCIAACLSVTGLGQTRNAFEEIRQEPDRAGTVLYMYDHDIPPCAKPPRGYKSFYISHYGRHGARNHSSETDFDRLNELLVKADARGLLTERGKELKRRYDLIYPVLHECGGDLCDRGFEQQHKIAGNMYRAHKHIFRRNARIDAVSTTVPRCILTMSAFCDQLLRCNPRLEISMQASNSTMYYTNPFSLYNKDVQPTDEGYNNKYAYWQKAYHDLRDELLHPELVFTPLLTDLGILEEVWDPLHLECALYATASGLQCNGKITESLWDFIPMDELLSLYECYNFRFYASKGPDTLFQKGRQWAFAWTTMQDILDKADEDISSGACPVRLRFGHDIIVMSLLALLDVDGYNTPVADIRDVKDVYRSYDFPMSLNLQFIFYRNHAGDVLVRMLYNERDLALPIPDCGTAYFYRLEDFRTFAEQRINLAHNIIATTQAPPKKS